MTTPFLEAFRAKQKGIISWEEYIHILLARWAGIRHEQDNVSGIYQELRNTDPFGYSIWCWSDRIETLRDTSPHEAVYKAYRRGTLDDVKEKFATLEGLPAKAVKESLAFLSLQERRADVLKYLLDLGGFAFEPYFHVEAESVDEKKDPETFKVLEESRFRELVPRKSAEQGGEEEDYRLRAARTFDKGGKLPVEW